MNLKKSLSRRKICHLEMMVWGGLHLGSWNMATLNLPSWGMDSFKQRISKAGQEDITEIGSRILVLGRLPSTILCFQSSQILSLAMLKSFLQDRTTVSLLGIIVYTGIHAYHKRSSRNITPRVVFFKAKIVCIEFLYLFQDKWEYIQKQGMIRCNDQPTTTIQPTDRGMRG